MKRCSLVADGRKDLLPAARCYSLTKGAPQCTHSLMQRMRMMRRRRMVRILSDGFQFPLHPPLTHHSRRLQRTSQSRNGSLLQLDDPVPVSVPPSPRSLLLRRAQTQQRHHKNNSGGASPLTCSRFSGGILAKTADHRNGTR